MSHETVSHLTESLIIGFDEAGPRNLLHPEYAPLKSGIIPRIPLIGAVVSRHHYASISNGLFKAKTK